MLLTLSFLALSLVLAWVGIYFWYFRRVAHSRAYVHHLDGRTVPGETPKLLVGNLMDVYRSQNQLSAYHGFHERFGEIVQIFWLWRQQISVTNYQMARQILVTQQKNYQKFPPNSLLQRLYGASVLTEHGEPWKRSRLLIQAVFSKKHTTNFHDIFVYQVEQLATQWDKAIQQSDEGASLNIYPDLMALFLDIIGKTAIGHDFGALSGNATRLFDHLQYVIDQSTRPVHQFTSWWKHLPLASNRKLAEAFDEIDQYLYEVIRQGRDREPSALNPANVLDLLLQSTELVAEDVPPLTDQEVRDNLLALIVNGHETVAMSVAMSLYLLAQHPECLTQVQAELDRAMGGRQGQFSQEDLLNLPYLDGILLESLRLYPPMAGLQRISVEGDSLEGWSIPQKQVVAITLTPLHQNAQYFGEAPEQFCPQRYLEGGHPLVQPDAQFEEQSRGKCPLKWLTASTQENNPRKNDKPYLPLTFGDGARRCLGEHFALYEMKVALAMLLYRFDFQLVPGFALNPELSKFGLFISMFPKGGVHLMIRPRSH